MQNIALFGVIAGIVEEFFLFIKFVRCGGQYIKLNWIHRKTIMLMAVYDILGILCCHATGSDSLLATLHKLEMSLQLGMATILIS